MAQQIIPSIDWPVRNTALTGEEKLLKQNAVADSTPNPKEELIETSLILDYILANLPAGSVQVSGGTISGSNLLLHRTNGIDITIDVSDLLDNINVVSGALVSGGNTLRLTLSDASTVDIDVTALNTDVYVQSGVLSGNTIVFTRTDASTFSVDVSALVGGGDSYVLTGFTVGTSSFKMSIKGGVSVGVSSGHATITVASGGDIKDLSCFIENSDMVYTDGTFVPSSGYRITINNAANSTSHTICRPVRIWKKLFSGAISTSNPAQAQNPLDTNEVIYANTNGIFSVAWNDLAANMPNGCQVAF